MAAATDLPSPNDYLVAVQNPKNCFADQALAGGQTVQTSLGLPKVASGNFAVVFQVISGQARYAVKCFTRRSEGQQRRYAAISRYLQERKLPYFVEFAYEQKGIRVRGAYHPIVKMAWAVGKLLHLFVEENLRRPGVLTEVAERWRRAVADLRAARVSHGDFQHRNVVVQGSRIILIDYDDMYVPALRGDVGTEAGHEHFQHPQRTSKDFGEWRDAFASIVIYLSLRAVAADHSLWREFHLGENLILSRTDFQRSGQTRIWGRLAQSSDEMVRRLALQLQAYCRAPVRSVPTLEEALAGEPSQHTATSTSSRSAPRVDYGSLGRALGVTPPTPSASRPVERPVGGQSQPKPAGAPAVDWQLLRRIEEAQQALRGQRNARGSSPPEAQGSSRPPPAQPSQPPRQAPRARQNGQARQQRPQPTRRAPRPRAGPSEPAEAPPEADDHGNSAAGKSGLARRLGALERAIAWIVRTFVSLVVLALTVTAVAMVGLYFMVPLIEAGSPGLAGALRPVIQTLREWGNTVMPTGVQLGGGPP